MIYAHGHISEQIKDILGRAGLDDVTLDDRTDHPSIRISRRRWFFFPPSGPTLGVPATERGLGISFVPTIIGGPEKREAEFSIDIDLGLIRAMRFDALSDAPPPWPPPRPKTWIGRAWRWISWGIWGIPDDPWAHERARRNHALIFWRDIAREFEERWAKGQRELMEEEADHDEALR